MTKFRSALALSVAWLLNVSACAATPDEASADVQGYGGGAAPTIEPQSYAGSAAPVVIEPIEPVADPTPAEADAGAPVIVDPKPAQTAGTLAVVSAGVGGSVGAAGQPSIAGAGGAAGSVAGTGAAGTGTAGMGGTGGGAAPAGVTKCKLASNQVIACDAFSKQYFPSWVLMWTVAQGSGSVTYNCNGPAPKCVAGSKCTVAHVDNGTSEMGVCQ